MSIHQWSIDLSRRAKDLAASISVPQPHVHDVVDLPDGKKCGRYRVPAGRSATDGRPTTGVVQRDLWAAIDTVWHCVARGDRQELAVVDELTGQRISLPSPGVQAPAGYYV